MAALSLASRRTLRDNSSYQKLPCRFNVGSDFGTVRACRSTVENAASFGR